MSNCFIAGQGSKTPATESFRFGTLFVMLSSLLLIKIPEKSLLGVKLRESTFFLNLRSANGSATEVFQCFPSPVERYLDSKGPWAQLQVYCSFYHHNRHRGNEVSNWFFDGNKYAAAYKMGGSRPGLHDLLIWDRDNHSSSDCETRTQWFLNFLASPS